jgi:S1-C subfamily serine protease
MRVWICVLMLASVNGLTHAEADWTALARELAKSVVPIELDDRGISCTGFVINAHAKDDDGKDRDYVATANHCAATRMFADQSPVKRILAKNTDKDLLVLEVEDLDRPALKLARENPKVGEQAASLGYGYGLERPMFRMTHISGETYIPYEGIGGPLFATDTTFVGGMSGTAVVNEAGEVVMMVQRGTASVGIGVGADVLRSKIGRYWEKAPVKP